MIAGIRENLRNDTDMDSSGGTKSSIRCPYMKSAEKRHTEGRRGHGKMGEAGDAETRNSQTELTLPRLPS